MRKMLLAIGLLISTTCAALAQASLFPQTLPANTVIGRLGVPTTGGPAQAIPISKLASSSLSLQSGLFYVGNGSNLAVGVALSGDAALSNTGVVTVSKTNGSPFVNSATIDATNAANITSGTLPAARLPGPGASTLGGIESITCAGSTWINAISTLGVPTCAQPAFSNISSTVAPAQLPGCSTTLAGSVPATGGGTANFLRADCTWAAPGGGGTSPGGTSGQIQYNNAGAFGAFTMSGDATIVASTGVITVTKTSGSAFAASATTDTTNATNIASGTLAYARFPSLSANTVVGSIAGGAPAGLTATQVTTLCNNATASLSGCVPSPGTATGKFLKDNMTWASISAGACILAGHYCVSTNGGTLAGAVTAAAGGGGGIVVVDTSISVSAAQAISNNIRITCIPGVTISTTSATLDLLQMSGTNTWIDHCALQFTGTGPKTAGSLINVTGTANHISDVSISDAGQGGCFICIRENGIIGYIDNVTINANSAAVSGTSGCLLEDTGSSILAITNFTCGSGPTHPYSYGIKVIAGALTGNNIELLQESTPFWIAPSAGVAAFVKVAASYLDNCAGTCLSVQPSANTGAVGYVDFQGTEFGTANAGSFQPIVLDTATNGGSIGDAKFNGGEAFAYTTNSGQAIALAGPINFVSISNMQMGVNQVTGILILGSSQMKFSANNNNISASTNCISVSTNETAAPIFIGNRCGGTALGWGGSSTTNVQFNP